MNETENVKAGNENPSENETENDKAGNENASDSENENVNELERAIDHENASLYVCGKENVCGHPLSYEIWSDLGVLAEGSQPERSDSEDVEQCFHLHSELEG